MTTPEIRKQYADALRGIADRVESGRVSARTVISMDETGQSLVVHLPDNYPMTTVDTAYGPIQ